LTRRKISSIQVIDRAVELLESIRKRSGIALTPLSKESKLALSTTKRLLDALSRHDLVQRSADGRYTIGPRFLRLITQSPERRRLIEAARPVLEKTMRELGEDIGFAVLQGQHAAIVLRVLGPNALKVVPPVDFREILERVRKDGYGILAGAYVPDAGGVAAPVFAGDGTIAAVIFSYVPIGRFGPKQTAKHIATITKAARLVANSLGSVPRPSRAQ
jgi:DNA-binding IclR family transcriptional regulator